MQWQTQKTDNKSNITRLKRGKKYAKLTPERRQKR